ncbi:MAG TPA: hypothetical protein V6C93_27745 [Allocoleopsis sp.]
MISAHPKKAGLRTYIGFVFSWDNGASTGTPDCADESPTFTRVYQSEQPLTEPPRTMKVSLPLAYCDKKECHREKVPTPEGFHLVE